MIQPSKEENFRLRDVNDGKELLSGVSDAREFGLTHGQREREWIWGGRKVDFSAMEAVER
jgi:hypothetical protein